MYIRGGFIDIVSRVLIGDMSVALLAVQRSPKRDSVVGFVCARTAEALVTQADCVGIAMAAGTLRRVWTRGERMCDGMRRARFVDPGAIALG